MKVTANEVILKTDESDVFKTSLEMMKAQIETLIEQAEKGEIEAKGKIDILMSAMLHGIKTRQEIAEDNPNEAIWMEREIKVGKRIVGGLATGEIHNKIILS